MLQVPARLDCLGRRIMSELWRPVVGYEGTYEVSDAGRVRRVGGRVLKRTGRGKNRYPSVNLSVAGVARCRFVHLLVIEAFVGPRPLGMQARHLNGDRNDPRLVNLRWGTPSENNLDRVAHGTHHYAARTACSQGHAFDDANTYITVEGARRCRKCRRSDAA